jgi:hypothetical protein
MSVDFPALVQIGDRLGQPVMTWHPHWYSLMEDFEALNPPDPTIGKAEWFVTVQGVPPDESFDIDTLLPDDIREQLLALAASLWNVPVVPEGGMAHLTGMTDHLGPCLRPFMAALKVALIRIAGDQTVALKAPIGKMSGLDDGSFPIHFDIFPGRYLLNIFNQPAPGNQGASLLLPATAYEELITTAFGPVEAARMMSIIRREVPWGLNHYVEVFEWHDDPEDKSRLIAATNAASQVVLYKRGEGYFVDDAQWGHGRLVVARDAPEGFDHFDRVHRLSFDTQDSYRQRMALG